MEPEEWLDQRRADLPRTSYVTRPYSLWLVAAVVFVAAMFGVTVAELLIWLAGGWGNIPLPTVGV